MTKSCVGICIGTSSLRIAVMAGGQIVQLAAEPLPENLVRDGQILSPEALSDELRSAARKYHISEKDGGGVLSLEEPFTRRTTVPYMTVDELKLNLPYEFHDYIPKDMDQYLYDYAVASTEKDENGKPQRLDLMIAAVRRETIADHRRTLGKAGFRMRTAVPENFAYCNLLRDYEARTPGHPGEYCIVDLGHTGSRVHLYTGPVYETTRAIEYGGAALDALIADEKHVDLHVAAKYKYANYEDVQNAPICRELYGKIGVEIMRALNFYRYNNPDSALEDVYLCGGLTNVAPLTETIRSTLKDARLHLITELMPAIDPAEQTVAVLTPAAVGATMQ